MNEFLNNHKRISWITLILIVISVIGVVLYYGGPRNAERAIFYNERIVRENPAPRVVDSVSVASGRKIISTGEAIPFIGDERVVIDGGKTLKESYMIAGPIALTWAEDAKLVYVHSLGTVTAEGVSSGWEIVFGSKTKMKGYVITVVGGKIIEEKEAISTSFGFGLPKNWYDSEDAIKSLQSLSQFSDATLNSLIFFYSEDGDVWQYALSTSRGNTTMIVR